MTFPVCLPSCTKAALFAWRLPGMTETRILALMSMVVRWPTRSMWTLTPWGDWCYQPQSTLSTRRPRQELNMPSCGRDWGRPGILFHVPSHSIFATIMSRTKCPPLPVFKCVLQGGDPKRSFDITPRYRCQPR